MIAIHQKKVIAVQKIFESEIEEQWLRAIKELNKIKPGKNNKSYLDEVKKLFKTTKDILTYTPVQLGQIIPQIQAVPKVKNKKGKLVKSPIKDKIIKALGYSNLRGSFYPRYFNELGIKACVYCNSQLAINAVKDEAGTAYSAKFDVDHYYPKDDYPFLSISLFNLYPACAVCNRLKSSNSDIEFDLYSTDPEKINKSAYRFKLTPHAKSKYLVSKDSRSIEFEFTEPVYSKGKKSFNDVFHIKGIYKTQLDVIEELIVKSQMYNSTYLDLLKESFKKLSLNPELFKRTLVGNYINDKDIHKRPMSKFIMDIAKDLELIDDKIFIPSSQS